MATNQLVMGDTCYSMSRAYRAGALAMRNDIPPCYANPHRGDTQAFTDWDCGHTNEAAGEHFRFGVDLVLQQPAHHRFEEDPSVPRDNDGNVDGDWYRAQ